VSALQCRRHVGTRRPSSSGQTRQQRVAGNAGDALGCRMKVKSEESEQSRELGLKSKSRTPTTDEQDTGQEV
jgi:hypothetical protein